MNLTASILDKVKKAEKFPVVITNNDYPLIQESAYVVQALESDGYKVETFVDWKTQTYGIRINK